MGLIVTRTGLTPAAQEYMKYLQPKNILIWQGNEIDNSIKACETGQWDFKKLIVIKMQKLIEQGIYDYHVGGII